MRKLLSTVLFLFLRMGIPAIFAETGYGPDASGPVENIVVGHGTATFVVATNMPGITVKGKSEGLHARAQIRRTADGLSLEHLQAWLPVQTLATGIALRDRHMRKYIFTTPTGEVPDVRFESERISCPGVTAGREASCKVSGTLSIRDISRTFSVMMKIHEANGAPLFRAGGDGLVKLTDYGIDPPSQLGVTTANEIQIHFEVPDTPAADGIPGGQL